MELAPMWMKGLTPLAAKKAIEELGETPECKQKCLTKLKELIEDEDGFEPLMTDAFLLRFLRAKKFDVKRAHKTLKNFYAFRMRYSGILTDFKPIEMRHILDKDCMLISPKRCPEGCGIFILLVGAFDVDSMTADDLVAAGLTSCEIGLETEMTQVCGSHLVFDMQGLTFSKMKHYSSIALFSKLLRGLQDCWPYRITAIHATHEPAYYGMVYSVIKPMMSKKLRDRIHFHGSDMASLHKFLPPETLPKQLGGTLDEKDLLNTKSAVLENAHVSENLNKYVYKSVKSPRYDSSSADGDHTLIVPKACQLAY